RGHGWRPPDPEPQAPVRRGGAAATRALPPELPQHLQHVIDVRLGVIRIDLKTDLLVAAGDDGVGEAGGEDAVLEEVRNEGPGLHRVADEERHDGVLAGDDLEAGVDQALLEATGE